MSEMFTAQEASAVNIISPNATLRNTDWVSQTKNHGSFHAKDHLYIKLNMK